MRSDVLAPVVLPFWAAESSRHLRKRIDSSPSLSEAVAQRKHAERLPMSLTKPGATTVSLDWMIAVATPPQTNPRPVVEDMLRQMFAESLDQVQ